MAKCIVESCSREQSTKHMCRIHYSRKLETGTPYRPNPYKKGGKTYGLSLDEKIEYYGEYIPETSCIWWLGSLGETGYAKIMDFSGEKPKCVRVARYIYQEKHGELPKGIVIRHKCDNRACVNIDHLETGTQADNIRDMVLRGRSRKGKKLARRVSQSAS